MKEPFSVIIIGAGIVGTATARELSRFTSSILILERSRDVSLGATKANSGIVHGGYTAHHGTVKAELVLRGNHLYRQLSEELGFPYRKTGSYVLSFSPDDRENLERLLENGQKNGVDTLYLTSARRLADALPHVNPHVSEALYCGETGIVSPYEAALAFAENAVENGVTLKLNHEVDGIEYDGNLFHVSAGGTHFTAAAVVNAAGLYADRIAALLGEDSFRIRPRKGEYLLLKRGAAAEYGVDAVVFQPPTDKGKGVLVAPTVWGNVLLGPNAEDTGEREAGENSFTVLKQVLEQARRSIPSLSPASLIRVFSGIRPASDRGDFIIEEGRHPGFVQAAGIESPGLTCAPAIAEKIRGILTDREIVSTKKRSYTGFRRPVTLPVPLVPFSETAEKLQLPPGDPQRIVCRCEQVPEKTIADALNRGIPVDTLDGVKRRTRAGMGACQGTFCGPRVKETLMRLTGIGEESVGMPEKKDPELLKALRKL